jgi:hypothetical protein
MDGWAGRSEPQDDEASRVLALQERSVVCGEVIGVAAIERWLPQVWGNGLFDDVPHPCCGLNDGHSHWQLSQTWGAKRLAVS